LTGALIARIAAEHTDIPAGVLNVVSSADRGAAGDALTGDPRVDMYHFTGSPAVGQRIMERAAVGARKVVLELGGKSANIVCEDADLDAAIPMGVYYCMTCSGQGCTLATRMIVHSDVYDDVLGRVEAMVSQIPWGDPMDPMNVVGPIIRRQQLERIEGLVDRARADGARVLVGGHRGERGGKGFWYVPTVLADLDENSEIAQTEVFGPVLSIICYHGGDDEAIRIANNSTYGLSAYVQTRDADRAWRIANRLKAGTVNVGMSFHLSPDTPFGGFGQSGIGREHGEEGFREYLQSKTISTPA
jgi:aldehyde dehydrogenase (NAD+)